MENKEKTAAVQSTRPFTTTTVSPSTATVCVSSGSMPSALSASATTPASRPQAGSACGSATAAALQISTPSRTFPPSRSLTPPSFPAAVTPTEAGNPSAGPGKTAYCTISGAVFRCVCFGVCWFYLFLPSVPLSANSLLFTLYVLLMSVTPTKIVRLYS